MHLTGYSQVEFAAGTNCRRRNHFRVEIAAVVLAFPKHMMLRPTSRRKYTSRNVYVGVAYSPDLVDVIDNRYTFASGWNASIEDFPLLAYTSGGAELTACRVGNLTCNLS